MTADDQGIHRHFDGSIDFDFYRRRAILLRWDALHHMTFRIGARVRRTASQLLHI